MKSAVLEREHKVAAKSSLSIFDPRRKGTDEDTVLKKHRPDLYAQKKNPSEKYRLARQLFERRTAAGLSQSQLAQKAGIGTATYQRIEECQPISNPGLDVVIKLANALGVGVRALFTK
jgi:DNA-binding XRE family transcriptional regulator